MGVLVGLLAAQFSGGRKYCKMIYIVRATGQGNRWAMCQGEMLSHKTTMLCGETSLAYIGGETSCCKMVMLVGEMLWEMDITLKDVMLQNCNIAGINITGRYCWGRLCTIK